MVTLYIAILLAAGLVGAKICQRLHLPSVSGYIFAGLLLGPAGFSIITKEHLGNDLNHFTQIALMLIAFGIGEHIEIKKLKQYSRSLFWIGIMEAACAFLTVSSVVFFVLYTDLFGTGDWSVQDKIVMSLLLGSIGIATAPAATLLVIRELKAKGPLTSTLMAIVAIDDGLAIVIFGLIVSIAHQILGHAGDPLYQSIALSVFEIFGSLFLGIITSSLFLLFVNRLKSDGELITGGLAALLICGELAYFLHLSPLLAGMAAGFTIVNKAEKDVRIFRALNSFEPPIYVLFFTLAGTHLEMEALKAAGLLGIIYFLSSISGKMLGIQIGGFISKAPTTVRKYLGFTMIPQAGVAIGLIFLLSSDTTLSIYMQILTPVVLAGVFISELIGPVSARFALTRAGEAGAVQQSAAPFSLIFHDEDKTEDIFCPLDQTFRIIPWDWLNLSIPNNYRGHIVFYTADPRTARGLARVSTIVASYNESLPLAVRIASENNQLQDLFLEENTEVHSMGYELERMTIPDSDIPESIVNIAHDSDARAIVLGYPLSGTVAGFRKLISRIAEGVNCPVAVVRFWGEFHTERILIPITDIKELAGMIPIVCAFDRIGEHRLKVLYLLSSTTDQVEADKKEALLAAWLEDNVPHLVIETEAVITHSRLEVIEFASHHADLLIMHGARASGVEKFLFGSLVDSVSVKVSKTLIVVYNTG